MADGLGDRAYLERLNADRALAAQVVFPHRHAQAIAPLHVSIHDAWSSRSQFVLIEGFRGCAKTTTVEEIIALEAAFCNFKYLLFIAEGHEKACQKLRSVAHELSTNRKIHRLFGKQEGKIWRQDLLITTRGVAIQALGWDQEVRSLKELDARPDRAHLDDVENRERTRDSSIVDQQIAKFYGELVPAMDVVNMKIRMTQTPLSADCMCTRFRAQPDWERLSFPICDRDPDDPDAVAIWPERFPMTKVRQLKKMYEDAGQAKLFEREYMLEAEGTQSRTFETDKIIYVDVAPRSIAPRHLILDPAKTKDVIKSSMSGISVVSRTGNLISVHASDGYYKGPSELIEATLDHCIEHDADLWVERTSLDNWLLEPFVAAMVRRNRMIDIHPLLAPQDKSKLQFIQGLEPLFRVGLIQLVGGSSRHQKLFAQLQNFPAGKLDVLNTLAYVPQIYQGTAVYEEFRDEHVIDDYRPERSDVLSLCISSDTTRFAAALLAISAQRIIILNAWISTAPVDDAVRDVLALVRVGYPSKRCGVYVPNEHHDAEQRSALMRALGRASSAPRRTDYTSRCRGALSPRMRTEHNGKRLFLVCEQAGPAVAALVEGYRYLLRADGTRQAEPEPGGARLLCEAMETLTAHLDIAENHAELPAGVHYATNAQGARYMTSLPRR